MSLVFALEARPEGMNSHVASNRNESWTDEKHVHFLNSVEAWFVRTMLENNDRYDLRLDRPLPDSAESTLDCKHNIQTRKKHSNSGFLGTTGSKMKSRPDRRSRRPPPPQPHDSPQDQVLCMDQKSWQSSNPTLPQVVPQIERRTGNKDEKDLPDVPVESNGTSKLI